MAEFILGLSIEFNLALLKEIFVCMNSREAKAMRKFFVVKNLRDIFLSAVAYMPNL